MQRQYAEKLVDGISGRSGGIYISEQDRDRLVTVLSGVQIPDTRRFHISVPNTPEYSVSVDESEILYTLSIRRILINENAELIKPGCVKSAWASVVDKFGAYDSDVITRKLREDPALVEAMKSSDSPYSLLLKGRYVDYSNHPHNKEEGPFLVIPGADIGVVMRFEKAHTKQVKPMLLEKLLGASLR